ncbi:radical SAM protein [Patescibacteria group bacterium]|nr:radical SAM protein [Patescibacteria group bacterium]MCL5798239.1 radical SAM protein [Patescibacteria group bacterium]
MDERDDRQPELTTTLHDRSYYGEGSLIYPVLSRRVSGLSVGINTSPSKICNFGCIYCEVDRTVEGGIMKFNADLADTQLRKVLTDIKGGSMGDQPIKAITLSGDGEPSSLLNFEEVVKRAIAIRDEFGLSDAKFVVISNASGLHRDTVKKGLRFMDEHNGELWAKLDAGTEDYYKRIAQTRVPFNKVLTNILTTAKERPIKIQSCFMNVHGEMPGEDELKAYADRVNHIIENGGQISAIQLYTVSRPPAESYVTALTETQMDKVAQVLQGSTFVPIEVYK